MTDHLTPAATDDDRRLAREWAESIKSATNSGESTTNPWSDRALAAARVILHDLPDPPLPTLADMTDEERAACRWMQCDYAGETSDTTSPGVIGYFDHGDKMAVILTTTCGIVRRDYARVTPRPDLPRLEWPGTEKPAPALPGDWLLADHVTHGRVVVTNPTPDTEGHVCFVAPDPDPTGYDWHRCFPDRLTYLDQEDDQ